MYVHRDKYTYIFTCVYTCKFIYIHTNIYISPTQSMIYVILLVNSFQKIMLLIVQYQSSKSCSWNFILQNLIFCTRSCSTGLITQSSWVLHFNPTIMVGRKYFVPPRYQPRREDKPLSGGPALEFFYSEGRVVYVLIQIYMNMYIKIYKDK